MFLTMGPTLLVYVIARTQLPWNLYRKKTNPNPDYNQQMEEHRDSSNVLLDVEFEPRLRTYTMVIVSLVLMITVVGIVLLPVWLIFGRRYVDRSYDNLFCQLTTRVRLFKNGVWFHTEKASPLDKIQDLTYNEGPVLWQFGLSDLHVDTAGQTLRRPSEIPLTGIVDARKLREAVLNQRNK